MALPLPQQMWEMPLGTGENPVLRGLCIFSFGLSHYKHWVVPRQCIPQQRKQEPKAFLILPESVWLQGGSQNLCNAPRRY